MRVLLENAGISFPSASASRRVDGDAYVATPAAEGHQRRRRGRHESAWRLHALREVQFVFNLREKCRCVFAPHAVSIKKQLITITDNETIGRVDRAIKRLRCDMRPNTIGNLVKSDLRPEFR